MTGGVEHLANLGARDMCLAPLDVVRQALKAQHPEPETVRLGDDPAPQLVLVGVAQLRRSGGLQRLGQVDRVGRLAREILLERNRVDLSLQPREDHLVFGRHAHVIHGAKA